MASDDMHVVMYKILAYLYDRLKEGEKPKRAEYNAQAMEINEAYWKAIMAELHRRRLVAGLDVTTTSDGDFVSLGNVRITMEGVEFLMDNSMMAKARQFLVNAKASIPFA